MVPVKRCQAYAVFAWQPVFNRPDWHKDIVAEGSKNGYQGDAQRRLQ